MEGALVVAGMDGNGCAGEGAVVAGGVPVVGVVDGVCAAHRPQARQMEASSCTERLVRLLGRVLNMLQV